MLFDVIIRKKNRELEVYIGNEWIKRNKIQQIVRKLPESWI